MSTTSVGSSGGSALGTVLLVLAAGTWIVFLSFLPRLLNEWLKEGLNLSHGSVTFPAVITALAFVTAYKREAQGTIFDTTVKVFCWMLVGIAALVCIAVHIWFVCGILSGRLLRSECQLIEAVSPELRALANACERRCEASEGAGEQ